MYLYYSNPELEQQAATLVANIDTMQLSLIEPKTEINANVYLCLECDGLYVYSDQFKPLNLKNFYSEFIGKRKPGIKSEILIQAINLRVNSDEVIRGLDTTAGLGRDAILMSFAGYRVTMLENNPYLAVILNYLCAEFSIQLPFLRLIHVDNLSYLSETSESYNFIYLDPMFNDGKQALAKKDMQLIDLFIRQSSVDYALDANGLFNNARLKCQQKLIVKRDNKQIELVANPKPTYVKKGKTIRFDVYQCN